jgi:large-conductance mechanosensitive channel
MIKVMICGILIFFMIEAIIKVRKRFKEIDAMNEQERQTLETEQPTE